MFVRTIYNYYSRTIVRTSVTPLPPSNGGQVCKSMSNNVKLRTLASSLRDLEPRVVQMWFKNEAITGHHIVISGITLQSIELTSRRFYQTGRNIYQDNFRLFSDAEC